MANTGLTIAGLGTFTLGMIVLIVMFTLTPYIGDTVDTEMEIPDNASANVVITFDNNLTFVGDSINLSGEEYEARTGPAAFKFVVSSGGGSARQSLENFIAEVNTNSTYFKAYFNVGTNTTTITAKDAYTGEDANDWAVSDNGTNISISASTFSGGIDSSNWDSDYNADIPTSHDLWGNISGFIELAAIILMVTGFLGVLQGMRKV